MAIIPNYVLAPPAHQGGVVLRPVEDEVGAVAGELLRGLGDVVAFAL